MERFVPHEHLADYGSWFHDPMDAFRFPPPFPLLFTGNSRCAQIIQIYHVSLIIL